MLLIYLFYILIYRPILHIKKLCGLFIDKFIHNTGSRKDIPHRR
jgi:hypothetical protein